MLTYAFMSFVIWYSKFFQCFSDCQSCYGSRSQWMPCYRWFVTIFDIVEFNYINENVCLNIYKGAVRLCAIRGDFFLSKKLLAN